MKLLYTLPDSLETALRERDSGELLLAVPYDIEGGRGTEGFFAVTREGLYRLSDGAVAASFRHSEHVAYRQEERYGLTALLAVTADGEEREICHYTSGANPPRFAMLLPYLTALAEGSFTEVCENGEREPACPRCGRPYRNSSELCFFCGGGKRRYRALLDASRGMRLLLLFPLLVSAVTLAIRFVVPSIQKTAINSFIYPEGGEPHGPRAQFLVLIAALIGFDLISRILGVLSTRISGIAGNRFGERLRLLLFEKATSLSLASVQRRSIGYLTERISGDTATIRSFLIDRVPTLFSQLLGIFVGAVLIFSISPPMSLMVLAPLPLAFLLSVVFRRSSVRRRTLDRTVAQRYAMNVQDTFTGERVIKAYGREDEAVRRYLRHNNRYAKTHAKSEVLYSCQGVFLFEVIQIGSYLLLFFGNLWLFRGELDAGTLAQFTAYSAIFYEPLRVFSTLPSEISGFMTALSQVREILEETSEIEEAEEPKTPEIRGHIEVKHVTFGYNAYEPVLHDLSFGIQPGEMVGIVGHSGSGKTTLVNLIMRLYDVTGGEILVDGENVKDISGEHLRSHIGVVPQEIQLFDGTVRDNIRYAKPAATEEEVIAAAMAAGAHDFILRLPEGYNSRVGEKGYSLSGGERQRIAIARALIHDPKILILDEATASLDTETERNIQSAIGRLTRGRTTIAIAHRLSTLRDANRLLVLDRGRLIEEGTHRELIERRGKYYELMMAQVARAQAEDDA